VRGACQPGTGAGGSEKRFEGGENYKSLVGKEIGRERCRQTQGEPRELGDTTNNGMSGRGVEDHLLKKKQLGHEEIKNEGLVKTKALINSALADGKVLGIGLGDLVRGPHCLGQGKPNSESDRKRGQTDYKSNKTMG